MVDEQSPDAASETTQVEPEGGGAPVNRDNRAEPGVIEGEVASAEGETASAGHEPSSAPDEAGRDAAPAPAARAPASSKRGGGAFLSGALGGLIVAALASGGAYYALAPQLDRVEADASRLAAIEAQAQKDDAAIAGLVKRVAALEENGSAAASVDSSKIDSTAQAVEKLSETVKDLRADLDAAKGQIPELSARLGKLESAPPQAPAADLSAVASRLDKIEAQLAPPKSESRVAPEKPLARDNPAAVAIVAASLRDKLDRGLPFSAELDGLGRLGVDPASLAPLKTVAGGAPTDAELAAAFESVRSKVLAAAAPPRRSGGIADRFVANLRGLVQVRALGAPNEAAVDPQSLASRIEADCRRGDVDSALAAFAKLPEAARDAAKTWAAAAQSRQAADTAIQSIVATAVARLAKIGEP